MLVVILDFILYDKYVYQIMNTYTLDNVKRYQYHLHEFISWKYGVLNDDEKMDENDDILIEM
jgi:hypothetical protein